MVEKINDGGPAYPSGQGQTSERMWNQAFERGMTLRDAFAIAVMPTLLSMDLQDPKDCVFLGDPKGRKLEDWLADTAYIYANALAARSWLP